MRDGARLLAVLLLAAAAAGVRAAEPCGHFPSPGFDGPDMRRVEHHYTNVQYLYSVELPPGHAAYTNPGPQPDHGVGIVLSWEPRAYLFVDGTYDAIEWKTPRAAATQMLAWTREASTAVLSHARTAARLGRLRAVRQVVRHRCATLPDVYVDDEVVAIDNREGIVYQLSLRTTEARYAADKALMDGMLASWRPLHAAKP
jgi:hypothetical protein